MNPVADIVELLGAAVEAQASDLHVRAGSPPMVRVDGRLRTIGFAPMSASETERIAAALMPPARAREYATTGETDFAHQAEGIGRFRINVFRERGTTALVLRLVPPRIATVRELGLPAVVERLADERDGLVLITGRAGSGKTTTLAAMIDHINQTRDGHVLTIEDPVEYQHTNKRCIVSQREIGIDTDDFRSALKRTLRQDPDVILIGEMRDPETVWAAMSAAETGHLVLSTLHTVTAVESVHRILDLFPSQQRDEVRASFAANLRGIVSQRLLARAGGTGRVPAAEILISTGRVIERITDPERTRELEDVIADGDYYDMQTFEQALTRLYETRTITRAVALAAATHRHDLQLQLDRVDARRHGLTKAATS